MEIKVMDLGKHKKWANHKPLYPGLLNLQRQYMYIWTLAKTCTESYHTYAIYVLFYVI
jgi:hypothetical protein